MAYVLALDQGTTSSRAILFDEQGAIAAVAQQEFTQKYPREGWVEHDPREIWTTQLAVLVEALSKADAKPSDVRAIGITNQRETTVVWDRRTGEPVSNAIVWQDRRTAGFCAELKQAGREADVQKRTGLLLDPYFSGTKVRWILDNVKPSGDLAFGTVDSWLIWNLTGGAVHATDPSNASRTLLYNIHTRGWDDELCALLGVPRAMLPEVRPSRGDFGVTNHPLIPGRIPIRGVAGDQQAALFGQACTTPGMAKNTFGTGCFMLQNTGTAPVASRNKLLTTVAWEADGKFEYALEGSVFIGGAVVQWLRDGLGIIRASQDVEALAASVPDSGGVIVVPAFAGLGAPHWDPYARGTILGLTRGSSAAHIARAAVESIAFQVAELLDAMHADAGIPLAELRVDGGAARNNALMQFQADLLGVPVVRPAITETTALGAARLAGLSSQWQTERVFTPAMTRDEAAMRLARWRRAVERARAWEQ
jgi:glycerol kinase